MHCKMRPDINGSSRLFANLRGGLLASRGAPAAAGLMLSGAALAAGRVPAQRGCAERSSAVQLCCIHLCCIHPSIHPCAVSIHPCAVSIPVLYPSPYFAHGVLCPSTPALYPSFLALCLSLHFFHPCAVPVLCCVPPQASLCCAHPSLRCDNPILCRPRTVAPSIPTLCLSCTVFIHPCAMSIPALCLSYAVPILCYAIPAWSPSLHCVHPCAVHLSLLCTHPLLCPCCTVPIHPCTVPISPLPAALPTGPIALRGSAGVGERAEGRDFCAVLQPPLCCNPSASWSTFP